MKTLNTTGLLYGCDGEIENTIPKWESITLTCVILLIVITALFGNSLVCIAVYKFTKLRTVTNALLCSLAVTDLLTPIIRLLSMAVVTIKGKWVFGCEWCKISSNLGVFLCSSSIIHLCVVSVERYLIIKHPLTYNRWASKRNFILLVIFIWSLSIIMSILPYLNVVKLTFEKELLDCTIYMLHSPTMALLLALMYFASPFLIMILVYYRIYDAVQKQIKSIASSSLGNKVEKKKQKIKKEWKAVKTVIVVIGLFFILWLPYFCVNAIHAFYPSVIAGWVKRLVFYLAYSNSCVNWIVYSVLNKPLRYSFKKLLRLTPKVPQRGLSVSSADQDVKQVKKH